MKIRIVIKKKSVLLMSSSHFVLYENKNFVQGQKESTWDSPRINNFVYLSIY